MPALTADQLVDVFMQDIPDVERNLAIHGIDEEALDAVIASVVRRALVRATEGTNTLPDIMGLTFKLGIDYGLRLAAAAREES